MEKLIFKTEAELLKRLIDGPLWDENGERLHFSTGICGFQITERTQTYKLETTAWLDIPLYTSEPFNHKTCPDKAVVMCWDDSDCAQRIYRFWDSKNKCAFDYEGIRNGAGFTYYQLIPDDQAPWMVPLRDNLDD